MILAPPRDDLLRPHVVSTESFVSSATLTLTSLSQKQILGFNWGNLGELYNDLCNLRALQIHIRSYGKRGMEIDHIVQSLPKLRSRRDFWLTFTVDGNFVPWDRLESKDALSYSQGCPQANFYLDDVDSELNTEGTSSL